MLLAEAVYFEAKLRGAMVEQDLQLELSIDLDTKDDKEAIQHLLSTLPLETVVLQTLQQAGINQPLQVALLITTDETIRSLNKQYRSQDKSTDILSFPLLEKPLVNAPTDQLWISLARLDGERIQIKQAFITPPSMAIHLGDIVISWPTILRQATETGHTPANELLFLLSHGILHLIGYDDQTEAGYQTMMRIQKAVLQTTEQKA
jgi:probable rRNA maturation factor